MTSNKMYPNHFNFVKCLFVEYDLKLKGTI